jgi:hypothetical protein
MTVLHYVQVSSKGRYQTWDKGVLLFRSYFALNSGGIASTRPNFAAHAAYVCTVLHRAASATIFSWGVVKRFFRC